MPGDPLPMQFLEIVDTVHMSHFVGEFYKSNIELLKCRYIETAGYEEPLQSENPPTTTTIQEDQLNQREQIELDTIEKQPEQGVKGSEEKAEAAIVFEQIDFERLQEVPNY